MTLEFIPRHYNTPFAYLPDDEIQPNIPRRRLRPFKPRKFYVIHVSLIRYFELRRGCRWSRPYIFLSFLDNEGHTRHGQVNLSLLTSHLLQNNAANGEVYILGELARKYTHFRGIIYTGGRGTRPTQEGIIETVDTLFGLRDRDRPLFIMVNPQGT